MMENRLAKDLQKLEAGTKSPTLKGDLSQQKYLELIKKRFTKPQNFDSIHAASKHLSILAYV